MFDSQNPMTALGMMYALRLTRDQSRARARATRRPSVSWFTRLTKAVASVFASRRASEQPATIVKMPTRIEPEVPTKRAA
jgi:hypothetical protein